MLVAVTGASGHIGNNLCRALVKKGLSVRALIHEHSESIDSVGVKKVKGDILDPSSLRELVSGADVVFHLAGKISIQGDPDGSVMRVNSDGTKNIVEASLACGVKRLVHFSASHVFQQEPHYEELDERRAFVDPNKAFPYERSKFYAEQEILKGIEMGLNAIILHPTSVIGPLDFRPSLLGRGLIDLYNGKISSIVPGGFDWVDVRDVVASSIIAMEKGKKGERYLLSGTWTSARALTEIAGAITGKQAPRYTTPAWLAKLSLPFAKLYGTCTRSRSIYTKEAIDVLLHSSPMIKSKKAQKEFGHTCRPLEETIEDVYLWFKTHNLIT